MDATHTAPLDERLEDEHFGKATGGKVGMWIFIAQDGMAFGGLLLAYAMLRILSPDWPVPTEILGIALTATATFILICSSVTMVMAVDASQHSDKGRTVFWLCLTILGGMSFLGIQAYEYTHLSHAGVTLATSSFEFTPGVVSDVNNLFGSTFYVVTGFHGLHVTAGVIYLICILIGTLRGKYTKGGNSYSPVELVGLFWHFVDLVWILVFTFIYLL
jgi:heme/copper-type cytochrome/quinol oxidase subunit 3